MLRRAHLSTVKPCRADSQILETGPLGNKISRLWGPNLSPRRPTLIPRQNPNALDVVSQYIVEILLGDEWPHEFSYVRTPLFTSAYTIVHRLYLDDVKSFTGALALIYDWNVQSLGFWGFQACGSSPSMARPHSTSHSQVGDRCQKVCLGDQLHVGAKSHCLISIGMYTF